MHTFDTKLSSSPAHLPRTAGASTSVALVGLLAVLSLSSCLFQPQQPTNHYFLEISFEEQAAGMAEPDSGIEVRVLFAEVNQIYNRRQIVQRTAPRSARFLIRDLWAEDLSESVSRLIADELITANLAANTAIVPGRSWNVQPHLRRLEHVTRAVSSTNDPAVYIDVDLVVTGPDGSARTFRHRDVIALENADLDVFAAGVTETIRGYADEVSTWILEREAASGEEDGGS